MVPDGLLTESVTSRDSVLICLSKISLFISSIFSLTKDRTASLIIFNSSACFLRASGSSLPNSFIAREIEPFFPKNSCLNDSKVSKSLIFSFFEETEECISLYLSILTRQYQI